MGIKNLTKFLSDKFPEVFERGVTFDQYAGKKIAVDTAIFMCKFKASNQDAWLDSFASLIAWFRAANVQPIFIMDSGSPPEKAVEKKKRAESRQRQIDAADRLERDIAQYEADGTVSDEMRLIYDKEVKRAGPDRNERRRFLLLRAQAPSTAKSALRIGLLKDKLERMRKHLFTVTQKDYDVLKQFLDVLDVHWTMAPDEAEKEGARMVHAGKADAVLSEDSDCLVYQTRAFLCKTDMTTKTVRRIDFRVLLETLDMTAAEFVDFCILCGTDYNPNMRGIGVCKAFDLIKQWKSIDALPDKYNTAVLNHVIVRKLFAVDVPDTPSELSTAEEKESKKIDKNQVAAFLFKHNMRTSVDVFFD